MVLEYSASHIKPFSIASGPLSVGSQWKKRKWAFEHFAVVISATDNGQKDLAGEEVHNVFDILPAEDDGDNEYAQAMAALDKHFKPKADILYQRSGFWRAKFYEDETVTNYVTRIRHAKLVMWGHDS